VDGELNGDLTLIDRAREGSAEAFGELIQAHHRAVRWLICRYVHDPSAADDLAQDVFLEALQGMSRLRHAEAARGWLLAIARHKAISHLRERSRRGGTAWKRIQASLAAELLARAEGSGGDVVGDEMKQALQQCVARLNTKAQSLVRRHYYDGLSAESIARQSGSNAGAVRMALFRIRRALAACVKMRLAQGARP
jgi:RNA polymerase sigma-70 factor (ECF subfamily)